MIWDYLKDKKKYLFPALIFLLLVDIAQLLVPLMTKKAIDGLRQSPNMNDLLVTGLIIFGLAVSVFIFRFSWRYFLLRMAFKIVVNLRNKIYYNLLKFSQHFFGKWETGDIMARAINDMRAVQRMFSFGIVTIVDAIVLGIASLIFMFSFHVKLTLIALAPMPILIFAVWFFEDKIHRTFREVQEKFSGLQNFVQEDFSGIFVIKAFNRELNEKNRFAKENQEYVDKNLKVARLFATLRPFIMFIVGLSNLLVLYFGGKLVISGELQLGSFFAFFQYLQYMSWPMMALGFAINLYQRGKASLSRVEDITEREPIVYDRENALDVDDIDSVSLKVKDLSFKYDNANESALKNINFEVKKGESVGIIGRIGSGKTTLVKNISRLVKIPEDTIIVNNRDINDYKLSSLRNMISYVPQDSFLFSTTIRENIAYFNPDMSIEKIKKAAEIADLKDAIDDLPKKYDTKLGERGVNLSGGQKQRMTIARAILKDAPFFIFDDSFSSIDTNTEEKILNNLKDILKNKTTIIIAHRISTIKYVDKIMVLDEGKIVEKGTHEELIKKQGEYYNIYKIQELKEKIAKE
ncbi:MAG: ABC transporter ATP-binding protein [Candidatus Mcinerneyibacterium aminivorans]|uniref:ABC transporter ATP-binding protein n=1 Tax=Candidatus Mcinerneyibacterium aminivorans TaxID=2703815 RepID=A0A5D0MH73_9BACT|nr:MAG: ABC transporter ATP-binding protein [Candidatus Mcinerneyibacterium aminivorans]